MIIFIFLLVLLLVPVALFVYLGSHRELKAGRFYVQRSPGSQWGFHSVRTTGKPPTTNVMIYGHAYSVGPFMIFTWDKE